VLRFTGSEVSATPFVCAKENDGLLCQAARETLELYRASGRVGELAVGEAGGLVPDTSPRRGADCPNSRGAVV
jgi:hypothetical protein